MILGLMLIYSMVVSRCQRDERPMPVHFSSVLTSLLKGGLQEMIPDQGEFLSVHYNIRLKFIYNLFYCHFKAAKR